MPEFITVKELAKTLGVSCDIAYKLVRIEGFPAYHPSPRRIIIDATKISDWLANHAACSSDFGNQP